MARVKRSVMANKRRKKVLKMTKGYKWRRKSTYKAAKEAMMKAGKYAYRDRRAKKRVMRRLWITRFNNALRELGTKYSEFVKKMKEKNVELNRKVLSQMAMENPDMFAKLVEKVK